MPGGPVYSDRYGHYARPFSVEALKAERAIVAKQVPDRFSLPVRRGCRWPHDCVSTCCKGLCKRCREARP